MAIRSSFDITPDDGNPLAELTYSLFVGVGGDIKVEFAKDSTPVILKNVPSGTFLEGFIIKKVYATDTTASLLVGLR